MVFRGRGEDQSTPKEYGGGGGGRKLTDIVGAGGPKKILQSLKVD